MTGYEIKNMIMERLRLVKMTYQEISNYTGLKNKDLTNHLQALRKIRFIRMESLPGRINYYHAINMTDNYEDVIKQNIHKKKKEERGRRRERRKSSWTQNCFVLFCFFFFLEKKKKAD